MGRQAAASRPPCWARRSSWVSPQLSECLSAWESVFICPNWRVTLPFASFTRLAINTFIGVPSIVMGIFVYFVMVKPTNTFSAVAGGLALGIIMIPIMARTTEDVLRLVPESIREGGFALGASRWQVTMRLVLPAARSGVITGGVLAIARVAGETAPADSHRIGE